MPMYTYYRESSPDEVWKELWSYDTHVKFLEDNPDIRQEFGAPAIVSGVSGIRRTDSGFNDVLNRISKANPHSPLAQTHGDKGITASKVREAVNKERVRQHGKE